jgi:hypothetical protein
MYAPLLGTHLSFALAFAGAFAIVLILVAETARLLRLVLRRVWQRSDML